MLLNTLKVSLIAAAIASVSLVQAETQAPQPYAPNAEQVKAWQEQFAAQQQQAEQAHAAYLAQMQAAEAQQLAALKANPYTAPIAEMHERMLKDGQAYQEAAAKRQAEFAKARQARMEELRKPVAAPKLDVQAHEARVKEIEAKRAEMVKEMEARRAEMTKEIEAQRTELQKQFEAQRKLFEEQAKAFPAPIATI